MHHNNKVIFLGESNAEISTHLGNKNTISYGFVPFPFLQLIYCMRSHSKHQPCVYVLCMLWCEHNFSRWIGEITPHRTTTVLKSLMSTCANGASLQKRHRNTQDSDHYKWTGGKAFADNTKIMREMMMMMMTVSGWRLLIKQSNKQYHRCTISIPVSFQGNKIQVYGFIPYHIFPHHMFNVAQLKNVWRSFACIHRETGDWIIR